MKLGKWSKENKQEVVEFHEKHKYQTENCNITIHNEKPSMIYSYIHSLGNMINYFELYIYNFNNVKDAKKISVEITKSIEEILKKYYKIEEE